MSTFNKRLLKAFSFSILLGIFCIGNVQADKFQMKCVRDEDHYLYLTYNDSGTPRTTIKAKATKEEMANTVAKFAWDEADWEEYDSFKIYITAMTFRNFGTGVHNALLLPSSIEGALNKDNTFKLRYNEQGNNITWEVEDSDQKTSIAGTYICNSKWTKCNTCSIS